MVAEDLLVTMPTEFVNRANSLITLLKAVGILAIAYFIWMIVKSILTLNMNKKLHEMHEDIQKIKKKLKIR